jgi:hypothetical protein
MNKSKLYPYVVPENYFSLEGFDLPPEVPAGMAPVPEDFRVPVGHGLYAILVEDENGAIRSLDPYDLEEAGLSGREAHALALDNLQQFIKSNKDTRAFQISKTASPSGITVVVWQGHWLAASCCRMPNLHAWAKLQLSTSDICVCVPEQSTMFLFAAVNRASQDEMRMFLQNYAAGAEKQISLEWFALTPAGLRPISDEWTSPVGDAFNLDIVTKRQDREGVDLLIVVARPLDASPRVADAVSRKFRNYCQFVSSQDFAQEFGRPTPERVRIGLHSPWTIPDDLMEQIVQIAAEEQPPAEICVFHQYPPA